jgi:hypothetical protein
MKKDAVCGRCGVPRDFSNNQTWGDNGTITQAGNERFRVVILDVDLVSGIFSGIQEMLGIPIDHITTEAKRKGTVEYILQLFSGFKLSLLRAFAHRQAYERLTIVGAQFGYGHFEVRDVRRKKYAVAYGRNIYYMPFMLGDLQATFNVVEGLSAQVGLEEKDGGYLFNLHPGEEDFELASRMQRSLIPPKPGDVRFERCGSCGAPLALEGLVWDLHEGILTDTARGQRLCVIDPEQVDSVLRELETELGEDISRAIIDVARRHTVATFELDESSREDAYINRFLSLRGLGNLVRYDCGTHYLQAVIDNASPPLLVTGMLQGICDLIKGGSSECVFTRSRDGSLQLDINAA